MPTTEFRRLRRILCNLGARILASEPKIRQEQEMRTMHVNKEHVTVKSMLLYPSANEAPCLVSVLMVKNLTTYIEEVFIVFMYATTLIRMLVLAKRYGSFLLGIRVEK